MVCSKLEKKQVFKKSGKVKDNVESEQTWLKKKKMKERKGKEKLKKKN